MLGPEDGSQHCLRLSRAVDVHWVLVWSQKHESYVNRFQPDPIKQWNMFSSKNVKKCKPKKQPAKKNKSKSRKNMLKKCKKKKAKAKGTHKKQNFKSQSVFGRESKYLTSCKQIFKLPAASKKNMEQKLIPSILTMIMM